MAITGASAEELKSILAGKTLFFNSYTFQKFEEDGTTDYFDPERYPGRWRVTDTHFESVWPPSQFWASYDIEVTPDGVNFISEGDAFKGYWEAPEE